MKTRIIQPNLKLYKKEAKPIGRYGYAKKNRRYNITTGEQIYIVDIQGERLRFYRLDSKGNIIRSFIYIDKKTYYNY